MNSRITKIAGVVLVMLLLPLFNRAQKVEIHQIDVGAGDAALINIKNNSGTGIAHSILIDAGDKNETVIKTVINYINTHARKVNGSPYLDYIISSHYDADHIGGLAGLVEIPSALGKKKLSCTAVGGAPYSTGVIGENSTIRYFALLDKGDLAPTGRTHLFNRYRNLAGLRRVTAGALVEGMGGAITSIRAPAAFTGTPPLPDLNQQLALGGSINLGTDTNGVAIKLKLILADGRVYNPAAPGKVVNPGAPYRATNTNNNNWGLGWVLEYGAYRYYTAGDVAGRRDGTLFDIETYIGTALSSIYTQPANSTGHICAQKVSHHGSNNSSTTAFLSSIKSTIGVISAGTRHDHPRQDVITRLENTQWNTAATNLANSFTTDYIMTELYSQQNNINLARGNTSGSMYWFTDQTALPLYVSSHTMLNGGKLFKLLPAYEAYRKQGHVVIKVFHQNDYNGVTARIDGRSIFFIEYEGYAGAKLSKKINCHHQ